jgi:hypothetical protein
MDNVQLENNILFEAGPQRTYYPISITALFVSK